jgi:hypothetical protein
LHIPSLRFFGTLPQSVAAQGGSEALFLQ